MKKIIFFITLLSTIHISAQKCDTAFSAANYAVSNTNKAYEGNNTEHVREWTEKAMEAFSEVEEIATECGCTQVAEIAYQGFEACDKTQVENTYERARFFAKRAREKAKLMITALSKCTNIPVSDIEGRRSAGGDFASGSGSTEDDDDYDNDLNAQQEDLLAKQKDLLEQQRLLQQQIADQQKQVAALKQQRANELIQQKRIKVSAEIALTEIQRSYEKLATSISCTQALKVARISFTRTVDALEKESLKDTKIYYTGKLNEIIDKFSKSFSECSNDW